MYHLIRKLFSFFTGVIILNESNYAVLDSGLGDSCPYCDTDILFGFNYCSDCGRKVIWIRGK